MPMLVKDGTSIGCIPWTKAAMRLEDELNKMSEADNQGESEDGAATRESSLSLRSDILWCLSLIFILGGEAFHYTSYPPNVWLQVIGEGWFGGASAAVHGIKLTFPLV